MQQTPTDLQRLNLELKQAHWNVPGTLFCTLHERPQEHYDGTGKYADDMAERLRSIGASSDGRANTIIRNSVIPELSRGFVDDAQVIRSFSRYNKATSDTDQTTGNSLQLAQNAIDKYR